jgi:GMP synthase-like glutamine amidotransferase
MRVLVIQNYRDTGLGAVALALSEREAGIDHRHPYLGEELPADHGGHDALIVLGGDQNALADEDFPYLPQLAELMAAFGDAGKAVLGICLGSQILARGYGATNILGRPPEFGWHPVTLTEEGLRDPFLAAAGASFPIFHWHSDSYTLPPSAIHLASSGQTANQAFRIGRAAYGIQFHFEADVALVDRWTEAFRDQIETGHPQWLQAYAMHRQRNGAAADRAGLALARAWVALI